MRDNERTRRRLSPIARSKFFRRLRIFFRSLKHKRVLLAAIAVAAAAVVFGVIFSIMRDPLPSWKNGAVKNEIISFINNSDDILASGYIPEEDRIAVIDLNGTLLNEKPLSFELSALKYRVENDQWMDSEQVQILNSIISDAYLNTKSENYNEEYKNLSTKAFYGMTVQELNSYIERFSEQQNADFNNRSYSKTFYQPIIEVIKLLTKNEYEIYIITSGQKDIARAVLAQIEEIEPDHVIGLNTHYYPKVSGSSALVYALGDEPVRGWLQIYPGTSDFNVEQIIQQTGKSPVFAVGNSLEDFSLLNYTVSNPNYNSLALLILHDDDDRETAYFTEEHTLWKSNAQQNNWKIISVKEDFKTLFNN